MTTRSEVVHLVRQGDPSKTAWTTTSFSPDPQSGFHHWYYCSMWYSIYQKKAFVCGMDYRGVQDMITADPQKVTCEGCKT